MDERVDGEQLSLAPNADGPDARAPHFGRFFDHLTAKARDFVWRYVAGQFPITARILDLDCGEGALSEKLIRGGFGVTAVDASDDALAACRQRLAPLRSEAYRVIRAQGAGLPFDDGEFDLVICLRGLDQRGRLGQTDPIWREARRVLKPGGILIVGARNAWTPRCFDLRALPRTSLAVAQGVANRLAHAVRDAGHPGPAPRAAAEASGNGAAKMEGVDGYWNPRRLIDQVAEHGYLLADFDGLGYGPLTLGERALLALETGIKASDLLDWFCHASRLIWFSRWLAAVNVYVFRRSV